MTLSGDTDHLREEAVCQVIQFADINVNEDLLVTYELIIAKSNDETTPN